MTPVLLAACHRLFPPLLPNTLMLLPILTRRFLTASRNCAAIFGVNDGVDAGLRGGRETRGRERSAGREGGGAEGREGGSFNEAGVIHTMLDKIRRPGDDGGR